MIEVLILLLFLCIISATLIANCPTFDSFLSLVTDTPSFEEYTRYSCLRRTPATQQLENALIRSRAEVATTTQYCLLFRIAHLRLCGSNSSSNDDNDEQLSFYGLMGRWRMSRGQVFKHSVFLALRDKAPLFNSYIEDKESADLLAKQWQDAEQAFLNTEFLESLQVYASIARCLLEQYGHSPVARMDAALTLLCAWKAAEQLGDLGKRKEDIAFLSKIVELVKHTQHRHVVEAFVADILFEKGLNECALELYRNVLYSIKWYNKRTFLYYHCMGRLAQANFFCRNYAAVVTYSTVVLEYCRNRLELTEYPITKLILLRCQSQLAQLQWDAWLKDRAWVQHFALIFGNTPELNFLTELYTACEKRDSEAYQTSCREFDRACPMTDEQIGILMLGKEKLL